VGNVATVTVLFSDLVGSTDLFTRVGEDEAEVLRREHFDLLREVVRLNAGREVKNLGDGLMVAFTSALDGVACAVGMQQRLDARNRRKGSPFLRVRVGVATGEADVDGNDYFGVPVVEAARLCSSAENDEIRVTEVVRALVGGRGDHAYEPLGPLVLKGFDAPVNTWQVRWRQLPTIAWQAPLPSRLQTAPLAFVGRTEERSRLEAALRLSEAGSCRLFLLSGEPGVGKTTLAALGARSAYERGAQVLYGRSDSGLGLPYQPWVEIVTHLLEHLPEPLLERLRPDAALLARLAPGPAGRFGEVPDSTTEPDHYLLYGAVARALSVASEDAPLVVVLDDLHWSDRPTLQLLRHLLSMPDPIRCVFIGTLRDTESAAESSLAELIVASHRDELLERVSLQGLSLDEVAQLMEDTAGQALPDLGVELARLLQEETQGNPFFVGEMLRHLVETGSLVRDPEGRWAATTEFLENGLPASILDVIDSRVEQLGDGPRRALVYASVIGREFDLVLLAKAMDAEEDEVLDTLERAMRSALVSEVRRGRFSFVHALVGHALYESLSTTRRARLHRVVAESMEDVFGAQLLERVAEIALHWARADSAEDSGKAIEYARLAGERALAQLAPDEALRWFRQALDVAEREPADPIVQCALLVGLGDAQRQVGDVNHRETLLAAATTAEKLGADDLLVRAALANNRGWHSRTGAADRERIRVLEAALAATKEPGALRARLLGLLAVELTSAGDDVAERRLALADEAVQTGRAAGDSVTLAWTLDTAIFATWVPERLADRVAWSEELVRLAVDIGDPLLEYWATARRTVTALEMCDRDTYDEYRERQLDLAHRLALPGVEWHAATVEVATAFLDGDLGEADRRASGALELGLTSGQPDAISYYGAQLVTIRAVQGRLGELEDLVRQQVETNPGIPAFRGALARLCTQAGRLDEAVEVLAGDIADGFTSFPRDVMRLTNLTGCAETIAMARHRPAAAVLYELLLPWADRFIHLDVLCRNPAAHALGRLATALGRYDDAERHFGVACEITTRVRAPVLLAMTQVEWAALLLERGSDDLARARGLVGAALKTATQCGAAGIERRARELIQV